MRFPEQEDLYYVCFQTAAGWVGFIGSYRGICRSTLPQKSKKRAASALGEDVSQAIWSFEYFKFSVEEVMAYFNGYKVDFSAKVDLTRASSFESAVWETARKIPYGETRSYSWVAQQINKPQAPRAVGQALGRNPLPIIVPCHRVLTRDGKLGGFGGGIEMKRYLLGLESKK